MPTQKPRIAITLSDECREALQGLAEAVGKPPATVAAELLAEMTPQMVGLAKYAKAMKSGKSAAAKQALVHMVGDAMAEAMHAQTPDLFEAPKTKKKPAK